MAEMIVDLTACIVSGGVELMERLKDAREEYSGMCADYFGYLSAKYGKRTFSQSACGFLLLDNLMRKNGVDRSSLEILRNSDGRPCVINRRDIDFSISHSEGAAMACLVLGTDAQVGVDIQRVRKYSREHLEKLAGSFMGESELDGFLSSDDRERYFYTLWTRREALYKRTGSRVDMSRGGFTTGRITACGDLYYYSISLPNEDE